jgi:hypothetical protein
MSGVTSGRASDQPIDSTSDSRTMSSEPKDTVTLGRLDHQIRWYGDRSQSNQRAYKVLKIVALIAAGTIPVLSAVGAASPSVAAISPLITAALGAGILGVESLQQLNQHQQNWLSYRSTAEALKHEKYLYAAKAGPYRRTHEPQKLLAVRIEGLISQEHGRWQDMEEDIARGERQASAS